MAEASELKTVNGIKTLDLGWLDLFEGLDEAIKTAWPDCTCDLLCKVHG
jgi:transposase-like protein